MIIFQLLKVVNKILESYLSFPKKITIFLFFYFRNLLSVGFQEFDACLFGKWSCIPLQKNEGLYV